MIDWAFMLGKLRGKHGSLEKVAMALEMNGNTIRSLDQGVVKDPRLSTGFRVINLFVREFPEYQKWAENQVENIL